MQGFIELSTQSKRESHILCSAGNFVIMLGLKLLAGLIQAGSCKYSIILRDIFVSLPESQFKDLHFDSHLSSNMLMGCTSAAVELIRIYRQEHPQLDCEMLIKDKICRLVYRNRWTLDTFGPISC